MDVCVMTGLSNFERLFDRAAPVLFLSLGVVAAVAVAAIAL